MLLKYFYDKALAQASYLLGDQQTGEALIIDPARDITPYLEAALEEKLTITQVAETHIHADFVSGSRELAARTGAYLFLSALGGYAAPEDKTVLLRDGEFWYLGAIRIDAIHTPGHTPEHLIFQFTDTANASDPLGLFTGDCLFVGDIGRPDLLKEDAASARAAAREQFANVQRLRQMPDYLLVLPGHGAGSACGKALGSMPSTTLGYEKRINPAFQFGDEAAFVDWLLDDQPEMPTYFAQMKRVNREGAALLESLTAPLPMEGFILSEALKSAALVIDTRDDGGHVPGALHISPSDKFNTYAGWFVDYAEPAYLIAEPEDVDVLVCALRAVGVDNLPGYFTQREVAHLDSILPSVTPEEAMAQVEQGALVLDVRAKDEYDERHIAGAQHIPYGELPQRIAELPQDRAILLYCASGVRSQIAASLLMKDGFRDFSSIQGGIDAWEAAGLPLEAPQRLGTA
jgi:hydroxyacylglutathione hydrolase